MDNELLALVLADLEDDRVHPRQIGAVVRGLAADVDELDRRLNRAIHVGRDGLTDTERNGGARSAAPKKAAGRPPRKAAR